MSNHTLQNGLKARQFDSTDFKDPKIKRILKKLSDIERSALPEAELKEVRLKGDTIYGALKKFKLHNYGNL